MMAPLSYSSGRPMSVAERLGPGARRLGRGGAAQRRLTRIVNQLRLVAKVRRQLTVLIIGSCALFARASSVWCSVLSTACSQLASLVAPCHYDDDCSGTRIVSSPSARDPHWSGQACGLLPLALATAGATGDDAEISQAELWIRGALRDRQQQQQDGGAKLQGRQGSFSSAQPAGSPSRDQIGTTKSTPAGTTLAAAKTVTRGQVLLVALMSTGLPAASAASLHMVLLGWLRWGHNPSRHSVGSDIFDIIESRLS